MSRLLKWEWLALKGDFSAIPKPFRWEDSGRLAHFINVHEFPGGFDAISRLALAMSAQARETGIWRGSARDLWLCLFFEHRAQRHAASDYNGTPMLEQLCETLRVALTDLSPEEARNIALTLRPSP